MTVTTRARRPATPSAATSARTTRALLTCGAAAGPLFIVVVLAQSMTRAGFDLREHPISLLSLGGLGWIQIGNFVAAGAMFLASAIAMRRAMGSGRAATWGPILLGGFGVSLIVGGVFVADPALGFPPGTPSGVPDEFSWHGILHAVAPVTGFLSLTVACFVLARRAAGRHQPGWAAISVTTGVLIQVLGGWTHLSGNYLPLLAAIALGFGWASAQMARVRAELVDG